MIEKLIDILIDTAKTLGLGEFDLNNAKELLDNREYGLAFDTIITQMYEYDIEIDKEFFDLLERAGRKMKISEEDYVFMKELIRDENVVPKPVKESLAEVLTILETKK